MTTKPRVVTADEVARGAANLLAIALGRLGRHWFITVSNGRIVARIPPDEGGWLIELLEDHIADLNADSDEGGDAA